MRKDIGEFYAYWVSRCRPAHFFRAGAFFFFAGPFFAVFPTLAVLAVLARVFFLPFFLLFFPNCSAMALPRSAGLFTVRTPARSSALNLSAAVPLPPETIAPAWPMRLPGGAVTPAM